LAKTSPASRTSPIAQPPVACDDHLVLADQDRVGKAERGDQGHDLGNLTGGMGPGIADVGHQPVGRHHLDLHGRRPPECGRPGATPALVVVSGSGFHPGNPATQEWQPGAETRRKCLELAACRASAPPHRSQARVEPRPGGQVKRLKPSSKQSPLGFSTLLSGGSAMKVRAGGRSRLLFIDR
jgi:hypothetical protein